MWSKRVSKTYCADVRFGSEVGMLLYLVHFDQNKCKKILIISIKSILLILTWIMCPVGLKFTWWKLILWLRKFQNFNLVFTNISKVMPVSNRNSFWAIPYVNVFNHHTNWRRRQNCCEYLNITCSKICLRLWSLDCVEYGADFSENDKILLNGDLSSILRIWGKQHFSQI